MHVDDLDEQVVAILAKQYIPAMVGTGDEYCVESGFDAGRLRLSQDASRRCKAQ
jgi:hypothetical protein